MKPRHLAIATLLCAGTALAAPTTPGTTKGLKAFETVRKVFQHPRCQNCHIPGEIGRASCRERVSYHV